MGFIKIIKKSPIIFCLASLLLGFYLGNLWGSLPDQNQPLNDSLEFHSGGYRLINPLYECTTNESYGVKEFRSLEETLKNYVNEITSKNSVTKVSVYFRDLNNGPWFGINEKDEFAPSSLLKLTVLMAYYKKAESDPGILSKKITYTKDPEGLITQNFVSKNKLEKGKQYSVDDLLKRMMQGSDNVSLGLLEENTDLTGVSGNDIDRVTLDLDVPTANEQTPNNFLSVKDYSALFRVLFNASYLNNEYSEKALKIMSNSEFMQGMVKPIPKNITVAHKFGERHFPDGVNQLHDCGIVYYPKRPYLLCLMTKGTNFSDLEKILQQISEKIYSEMSQRYPQKFH